MKRMAICLTYFLGFTGAVGIVFMIASNSSSATIYWLSMGSLTSCILGRVVLGEWTIKL